MGRVLIIIVLLLTAIFAGILITVHKHTEKMPEIASENLAIMQMKHLGAYALNYGIKNIPDTSHIPLAPSYYPPTFSPFDVLDGSIDYIKYSAIDSDKDTIRIVANVSYGTAYHQSSAVVKSSNNIPTNAIGAGGSLTIKGKSYEINGDTASNVDINFEEIFGMTKEEMKVIADTVYTNPPNNVMPVENITWIVGDLKSSAEWWEGSGLLIVTGNCKITGGKFSGILYVMGEIEEDPLWVGPCDIYGAIICEGGTTVAGKTTINYDGDIVNGVFDDYLPPGSVTSDFKIRVWRE